jgi:long-chain acyl-CoA synthetase
MARQTAVEYIQASGDRAVVWRRGYRMVRWSYAELRGYAAGFARELEARGIAKGDRVLLWGENTGEWVAAFLGCMLRGAIAVPMDGIADRNFAARVAQQAGVRLAVTGREWRLPEDMGGGATAIPRMVLEDLCETLRERVHEAEIPAMEARRDDPVEIVFTSGTTAEPRGVVLTHGNLLANLEPIEREFQHYRRYERFVHPVRILDLLPLSHVFGQLLGVFIPQILRATAVFVDSLNPAEVAETIRRERISALVTVPRLIESLREQIEREWEARGELEKFRRDFAAAEGEYFLRRWWRFRAIHQRFGWKFWSLISGGAALPAEAEQFWTRLGFAVIQGYGLTETTSLVSLNHPFRRGQGSIGKALPGMDVKLSEEGEILVRGENVAAGYWQNAGSASGIAPVLDAEGWFHTGDLGERDAEGNLYFKGRRKNVIVTPEGLNIYPEDLEAEVRKEPEVRDCVVIGIERDGNAEPCAVLLPREGAEAGAIDAGGIVQRANERLAGFQQMRMWTVWHDKDFPRTPTHKPMLGRIRAAVEEEMGARAAAAGARRAGGGGSSALAELVARVSHGRVAADGAGGGALQLSSIERVELMSAIEDRYQVDLSEAQFTKADSMESIAKLLEQPGARAREYRYPRWAQKWWTTAIRVAAFYLLVRPAMLLMGWPRVRGRENLRGVAGPVLVAANHIAFIDPGFVLQALPARLRHRLATAMDGELLETMRVPPEGTPWFSRALLRMQYLLVVALFNVFPLPRQAGFRKSFAFAGELTDGGWSVLVFPEGERTRTGQMKAFRAGIGLLATRLRVPVVPVRIDGLFERKVEESKWARPGQIKVTIGAPVTFGETTPAEEIARELERRVAELAAPSR